MQVNANSRNPTKRLMKLQKVLITAFGNLTAIQLPRTRCVVVSKQITNPGGVFATIPARAHLLKLKTGR